MGKKGVETTGNRHFQLLTLASGVDIVIRGNVRVVEFVNDLEGKNARRRSVLNLERLSRANERNGRSDKEGKQDTTESRFHVAG
jgi:hypothetical protein